MPTLIETSDYQYLRNILDASVDADTLPDPVIESPLMLKRATDYIVSRTSDLGEHAKNAAIFYLASLLLPSMQGQITAAHVIRTGGQVSRSVNWKEFESSILNRMEEELALIPNVSPVTVDPEPPPAFIFVTD